MGEYAKGGIVRPSNVPTLPLQTLDRCRPYEVRPAPDFAKLRGLLKKSG